MTSRRSIPSLDGLRAISIALVLLGHAKLTAGMPVSASRALSFFAHANLGVTIFFVISGFLITTLLLNERRSGHLDVARFYVRRALRIVPVCYLAIAVTFVVASARGDAVPPVLYAHAVTYTVNFARTGHWLLGHLWSLGVEEQFYLCWPWIILVSPGTARRTALALIAWAPISRVFSYVRPEIGPYLLAPFFNHADSIMIGCLTAFALERRPLLAAGRAFCSTALRWAAVFVMVFVEYAASRGRLGVLILPLGNTIVSFCAAYLILSGMFTHDRFFRFLNHPVVTYLGVLSYSLYLWQQAFLYDASFAEGVTWWRTFPVNLLFAFAAAAASYHLWERPFLRFKERFSEARTLPDPANEGRAS